MRILATADDLLGKPKGFAPRSKRVFIAFRMNVPTSVQMRSELGDLLKARGIEVVDGHVRDWALWPTEIRKRINSSKLVVADVTGPSREVLFETGYSSTRALRVVVESRENVGELPTWLRSTNVPSYSGAGVTNIANQIAAELATGVRSARRTAVPGRVCWIQHHQAEWCSEARAQVERTLREKGIAFDVVNREVFASEELAAILKSWLVIAAMDGSVQDYLSHYVLGDTASVRSAGSGSGRKESLRRHGMLLTPSSMAVDAVAASSLLQIPTEAITRVTERTVHSAVLPHIRRYIDWLKD